MSDSPPNPAPGADAMPPALETVLVELLVEKGWSYLRYRHLARAMELAGSCESVLLLNAGRGLAGLALALEYPATKFTISELPARKQRFVQASALAKKLGIDNVAFASVDPLDPPEELEPHDLVASVELLQLYPSSTAIADAMMRLSRRFTFALVPYADARTRTNTRAKASAMRRQGHHAVGYDALELFALFPNAIAIRGCYWNDAGATLRTRLADATPEAVASEFEALVGLGEAELRRGWPRTMDEASGIWILSRAGVALPGPAPRTHGPVVAFVRRLYARGRRAFGRAPSPAAEPIVRTAEAPDPRTLLTVSGMFDAAYYLARYADVAAAKVDALDHYVRRGGGEGRWAHANFDGRAYARAAKIDPRRVHPAIHYLAHATVPGAGFRGFEGGAGASNALPGPSSGAASMQPMQPAEPTRATRALGADGPCAVDLMRVPITIVVPVYDGGDHVRRAIEAIRSETRLPNVELLLIDDASTDMELARDLEAYGRLPGVTLLRNPENLGFTRTVNRGLEHARAGARDVVLLNSDTRVGPQWLEMLVLAAYDTPRTATATALSDSAGAFSTPRAGANDTTTFASLDHASRASRRAATEAVAHVPTGNGFCMYMRRDALEDVGLLDAVHFLRGYGEENDWCLRATERGYSHAIALRSYVHHVNAVSFAGEKTERVASARAVLDALHPDYTAQIRDGFGVCEPLAAQRASFERMLQPRRRGAGEAPRPRVMYVTSTKTGGTPQTNRDLMRGVAHLYHPLLLSCDTHAMTLDDASVPAGAEACLARHELAEPIAMLPHTSAEYDDVIASWLTTHAVELVHIRHMAWHSLGLTRVARRLGIPVVVSLHDFYTLCPSVNLTDGRARWSPDGFADPTIVAPLWERTSPEAFERAKAMPPSAFFTLWQRRMNTMLEAADRYVTTSHIAKDLLARKLPVLAERSRDFHVIAHGRDFDEFARVAPRPTKNEPLRVLLPGNIGESKGMHTVLALLALDTERCIEIHTLGNVRAALQNSRCIHHGTYERDEFLARVREIQPHVALIASLWPETFCHTLTESWAAGIPVLGSNLGAVGERLAEAGAGWCIDAADAPGILALCRRLRDEPEEWDRARDRVVAWQDGLAREQTVAAMTSDYLDLYRDLFRSRLRFGARAERAALGLRPRVAVVARGVFPTSPATVHVRIASVLALCDGSVDYTYVSAATLARTGVSEYDGVLVCRDADSPAVLDALTEACVRTGTPWAVDIDDDLLNVPADKDEKGVYARAAPALRRLIAGARRVFVSTEHLAHALRPINDAVTVAPNELLGGTWLSPISADDEQAHLATLPALADAVDGTRAPLRLLYVGSRTHKEDLDMIMAAVTRAHDELGIVLHLVGIDREDRPGVVRLEAPSERYDRFVPWLRVAASRCDIALAPLVDTPFNRGKSHLKVLEYAALGLPVVASDVGAYATAIHDGEDGLLVSNDSDAWFRAIERLANDAALRSRLAARARGRLENERLRRRCHFDTVDWSNRG